MQGDLQRVGAVLTPFLLFTMNRKKDGGIFPLSGERIRTRSISWLSL
jgi:hypothetical protein